MNILSFQILDKRQYRKQVRFVCRNTQSITRDGVRENYPVVVLVNEALNVPIWYPGYEKYICNLRESEGKRGETRYKQGNDVCSFLNYLIHETSVGNISQCTDEIIGDYLQSIKTKDDGSEYDTQTWYVRKDHVIDFLRNYYIANKDKMLFSYDGEALISWETVLDRRRKRRIVVSKSGFNVAAPSSKHRKNRFLLREYLDLMLYEAMKYDPEITLAIMLQAYAGLREGEIVNLTYGRIQFDAVGALADPIIEIDLTTTAEHIVAMRKKTNPGAIKKFRTAWVYKDFVRKIMDQLEEHKARKISKGMVITESTPVFHNYQGRPMSVQTYQGRVKELFYKYFLPGLIETSKKQGTWAENAPYIESYEEEYPGAHAFRHWFTMYLIEVAQLKPGEVMKLRGDSSIESMIDYIHENETILKAYREVAYSFQEHLLEDAEFYDYEE